MSSGQRINSGEINGETVHHLLRSRFPQEYRISVYLRSWLISRRGVLVLCHPSPPHPHVNVFEVYEFICLCSSSTRLYVHSVSTRSLRNQREEYFPLKRKRGGRTNERTGITGKPFYGPLKHAKMIRGGRLKIPPVISSPLAERHTVFTRFGVAFSFSCAFFFFFIYYLFLFFFIYTYAYTYFFSIL